MDGGAGAELQDAAGIGGNDGLGLRLLTDCIFLASNSSEASVSVTLYTPAEPQHWSASGISTNSTPGTARISLRGASRIFCPCARWQES